MRVTNIFYLQAQLCKINLGVSNEMLRVTKINFVMSLKTQWLIVIHIVSCSSFIGIKPFSSLIITPYNRSYLVLVLGVCGGGGLVEVSSSAFSG